MARGLFNDEKTCAHFLYHAELTQENLDALLNTTYGNGKVARFLIQQGARGVLFEKYKEFPLHVAILQALISNNGLEIIKKNSSNETVNAHCEMHTPLTLAAKFNEKVILELLLPFATQENKDHALLAAVRSDEEEAAALLIQAGANVNMDDLYTTHTFHPLFAAVSHGNSALTKLLLENGAHVDDHNKFDGATMLHWACNSPEIITLLLHHGAHVDKKDANGQTPLQWAVKENSLLSADILIKAGANINIQDNEGTTPLQQAIVNDNLSMAELLLDSGADSKEEASISLAMKNLLNRYRTSSKNLKI
jgi:ankyrin repeat protein